MMPSHRGIRRGHGAEDRGQHPHGAVLVERMVAVAALGGVHARRAPGHALARVDRLPSRAEPADEFVVAAVGEAGAARVAVVDEHGGETGVRVQRGRHAADVAAVAGRHQRKQADGGVFGGVQRTGTRSAPMPCSSSSSGVTVYITARVCSVCAGMSSSTESSTSPDDNRRRYPTT